MQAATISAHNDAAIGETVADALEKVGAEGTTAVEEAKGTEMTVERVVRRGVVVDRMRSGTGAFGFDAGGTYVDLVEAGIIDPTKVVRIALENAVSAASVLLLTEATLTEVPNPSGKPAEAA